MHRFVSLSSTSEVPSTSIILERRLYSSTSSYVQICTNQTSAHEIPSFSKKKKEILNREKKTNFGIFILAGTVPLSFPSVNQCFWTSRFRF